MIKHNEEEASFDRAQHTDSHSLADSNIPWSLVLPILVFTQ
jgi:hypothetical protein